MTPDITDQIAIACESLRPEQQQKAALLAQQFNLPVTDAASINYPYLLVVTDDKLAFRNADPRLQAICSDFLSPKANYRRLKGGGKQQLIAKAVGIKNKHPPTVIDATAGLGADGFTLATLGCRVTMLERSIVIGALLQDSLTRMQADDNLRHIKLSLIITDAISYLNTLPAALAPDVVYLDPMFPAKSKQALAKKEMRILRELVGNDADAGLLLDSARHCAKKRVVVKRHRLAPVLADQLPDLSFSGQSSRFDVYLRKPVC